MSLNIFAFCSIVSFLCASTNAITASSFPAFSNFFNIELYIISYNAGTHTINVIPYSLKFSTIWRGPSANDVHIPLYKDNKNPAVHSNTW